MVERKRGIKKTRIMHNKKLFRIIIILIAIFIGLIFFIAQGNKSKNNSAPQHTSYKECEKDSDCIKVKTGCCSCNMGGEEKCVPVSEQDKYVAKKCDLRTMCIAMYACNIESCACIDNKCSVISNNK